MPRIYCPHMPSNEIILKHYCEEGMSAPAIAKKYGVSKPSILRRLRAAGVEMRPTGRGLANRGVEPPTADELQRFIHVEHQSYEEIGGRYGVTRGAVMHWVKAHGIERPKVWVTRKNGFIPPPLDEPTLRRLYESGLSTERIGAMFNRSGFTVAELCRTYGIEVKPGGWSPERIICSDGHIVRSEYEHRVCEWLWSHQVPHAYESPIGESAFRCDFLANGWYIEVWGVQGSVAYNERRERKEALYRTLGLPLIGIEFWHLDRQRKTLDRKLRPCLVPTKCPLGF